MLLLHMKPVPLFQKASSRMAKGGVKRGWVGRREGQSITYLLLALREARLLHQNSYLLPKHRLSE